MVEASTTLQAIGEAFATVAYPGDDNIAYDQNDDASDGWKCAQVFKRNKWQDVRPSMLFECMSLTWFTPEAFRYYLPAYMRGTLLHAGEIDFAADAVIYALIPPVKEEENTAWRKKMEPLTPGQKTAIRMFLEVAANNSGYITESAQKALDECWFRF